MSSEVGIVRKQYRKDPLIMTRRYLQLDFDAVVFIDIRSLVGNYVLYCICEFALLTPYGAGHTCT